MTKQNDRLAHFLAKEEMLEQIGKWTRGADMLDKPLMLAPFSDDALIDYGGEAGMPAEEFIDWVMTFHGGLVATRHSILTFTVNIRGDQARSEAIVLANLRYEGKEGLTDYISYGRYLDKWVRADDEWKISWRRAMRDMNKTEKVSQNIEFANWGSRPTGKRDRSDASYAHLDFQ